MRSFGGVTGYRDEITDVVARYREEIEADLVAARMAHERARAESAAAERLVQALEAMLAPAGFGDSDAAAAVDGRMTLHAAMRKVLEESQTGMMRAADLANEINRQGLYRMRDGRPVEAQQVHARVGHYADQFAREGTFIKLI